LGTGAVGVVRGFVCVGAMAVVVGAAAVVGAVVGAWTAGSGFSPHPVVASVAAAAAASASGRTRRHPDLPEGTTRFKLLTPGTVTNRPGA
jgi:hypothetical protein